MYMLAAALLLICILAAVTRANEEHPFSHYDTSWKQAVHVVTPTKREIIMIITQRDHYTHTIHIVYKRTEQAGETRLHPAGCNLLNL